MKIVSSKAEHELPVSAEWQTRVDLAAAHRLAAMHGLNEGIFNHLTVTVPGKPDRFLLIPFGIHWSEVTASSLMEVGYDGQIFAGEGEVERSAFCIHAPIHQRNPNATCVFHTHMPFASALTRLEDPRILPIGQTELRFQASVAYDELYTGLAYDPAEGARLADVLGPTKTVLFMSNHGVCVIGKNIAQTYDRLYYLERVCQVQLYAMWTGQKLKTVPGEVVDHTISQFRDPPLYGNKPAYEHHFAALKRILDRSNPGYAD